MQTESIEQEFTPPLTDGAYQTVKEELILAQQKGLELSADTASRNELCLREKEPKTVLDDLLQYSTIFICGVNEINEVHGTN